MRLSYTAAKSQPGGGLKFIFEPEFCQTPSGDFPVWREVWGAEIVELNCEQLVVMLPKAIESAAHRIPSHCPGESHLPANIVGGSIVGGAGREVVRIAAVVRAIVMK